MRRAVSHVAPPESRSGRLELFAIGIGLTTAHSVVRAAADRLTRWLSRREIALSVA
jgi:hypothetical protein